MNQKVWGKGDEDTYKGFFGWQELAGRIDSFISRRNEVRCSNYIEKARQRQQQKVRAQSARCEKFDGNESPKQAGTRVVGSDGTRITGTVVSYEPSGGVEPHGNDTESSRRIAEYAFVTGGKYLLGSFLFV